MDNIKTVSFEIPEVRLPSFQISDEDKVLYGVSDGMDIDQILRQICIFNFKKKVNNKSIVNENNIYSDRVKHELDILKRTKFAHYILIIWDTINFCKKSKIPVGPGRGSGAGSLINYLIGITDVDPIKYGLIFERFISMSRAKMRTGEDGQTYYDGSLLPDIDCDICPKSRHLVYDYINNKYKGKVSKVSTLSTLQSKVMAKNLCKIILGFSEIESMAVSRSIPVLYGKVFDFEKARENSGEFDKFCKENEKFYKIGLKLAGAPTNFGVHASAVLISYEDIDKVVPCIELWDKKQGCFETVSEYHMHEALEHILKVDLLGLNTLTIIDGVCKRAGIKPEDIPIEDYDSVYKYLQNLTLPYGIFQFSGKAVLDTNNKIQPKNLQQATDVTALSRPGAMDYIDSYIGKVEPTDDARILKIIGPTNNVAIYQEQLIRMAKEAFSLTEDEGEQIRRASAKKKPEEVAKWEAVISENSNKYNVSQQAKDYYLKVLKDSANYSFNLSHSLAYTVLSAQTVYLKFHYPLFFYMECLPFADISNFLTIKREAKHFGIEILGPDIYKSEMDFCIEGNNIRIGLSDLKNIKSPENILLLKNFLGVNKFELFNTVKTLEIPKSTFSILIQAGMLNSISEDRLLLNLEFMIWNQLKDNEQIYCLQNGSKYNFNLVEMLKSFSEWTHNGKPFRSTRINTIRKECQNAIAIYSINKKHSLLASYIYEKHLLGFSYTTTLREIYADNKHKILTIEEIQDVPENKEVSCVIHVKKCFVKKSLKSGKDYIRIEGYDDTGEYVFQLWAEKATDFLLKNKPPEEEDIIYLEGRKGTDIVWLDKITAQDEKIISQTRDLNKHKKENTEI